MSDILPETPLGSPKPTVRVISDGKPAPELVAAMAETRIVREALKQLVRKFADTRSHGWTALISGTDLRRLCKHADIPMPDSGHTQYEGKLLTAYEELDLAFADARDTIEAMEAELAELREHRAPERLAKANTALKEQLTDAEAELAGLISDRNRLRSLINAVEGAINDDVLAYHERYARANQLLGRSERP